LSLVTALVTALGEAAYFRLTLGADPMRLLQADLSLTTGVRPAVIVLAIGLAVTAAGSLRATQASSAAPRLSLALSIPHRSARNRKYRSCAVGGS
jgi:hypothetical protein